MGGGCVYMKETVFDLLYTLKDISNRGCYFVQDEGEDKFVSFKELYQSALNVGARLHANGMEVGEELVISISEPEIFFYSFWGCILYGIIPVPIAINMEKKEQFISILSVLNQKNILTDNPSIIDWIVKNKYDIDVKVKLLYSEMVEQDVVVVERVPLELERKQEDIIFVLFSSGSTSMPKGVGATNKEVITSMSSIKHRLELNEKSTTVSWLSINHSYAIAGAHLLSMYAEANQCYLPTRRFVQNPIVWIEYMNKYQCDLTYGSNFALDYTLKFCKSNAYKLQNLNLSKTNIMVSAEPTSLHIANQFLELLAPFGMKKTALKPVFGMTEATACITVTNLEDCLHYIPIDKTNLQLYQPVSILDENDKKAILSVSNGKVIDCLEICITDDNGKMLPEKYLGHFLAKGDTMIRQYYNTNIDVQTDHWFDTGDIGFISDGELYITSRYKHMFIINSKNYYSTDLEHQLITEHICEDNEIWVVGYRKDPDDSNDSVVCFIPNHKNKLELANKAEAISNSIRTCFSIMIEQVVPVDEIPKTDSGKVQRYKMLECYINGVYHTQIEEIKEYKQIAVDENEFSEDRVCRDVIKTIYDMMGIELEEEDYFSDAQLTSLQFALIYAQLEQKYNGLLSVADLYEFPTAKLLSQHIIKNQR